MPAHSVVVPYDPDWPRRFEEERTVLEEALGPWLVGGIHHVGSTAVPGMPAKPVIDMIAGVRSLGEARDARGALAARGYMWDEHRPDALWFRRPAHASWSEGTHSLHLTEPGSDLWRERLTFRDALRTDPALADEYARWKLLHAAPPGEPRAYTDSKRPFVARVLGAHGIDLRPDHERLSPGALARRRS